MPTKLARQVENVFPKLSRTSFIYYCIVLTEEQDLCGFILPSSLFNLRFLHATRPLTLVIEKDKHTNNIPSDAVLLKSHGNRETWQIPISESRCTNVWSADSNHHHQNTLELCRLIYIYKIVYICNVTYINYGQLQTCLQHLIEYINS
uniref:GrBNV_gp94-like protein n=1 Tax=Nilaparvata lugens endogenous nudivirus TaxID=1487700 RepID=X5GW98_9VIRU|nr:GrBNV_gp94-like protein [Nilaparvata lugens endogenous nudivirus]